MASNTIITSTVTGGTNSHTTVAEEANAVATDFVTQGVVGAITLNSGSGGTGSFCVNADSSPDMGVTVKAGQAYVTATPSSQDSQVLRARASSDYTAYTINANSSGSTKYDWIYLKVDATKANNPASDASDVTSIYTSRSSSNSTDNGSPPTYGLLLAIVTVANGASSITNSNITDKRFNTSIGAQNGSLIVTQNGTGTDAIIQAAGTDANINTNIKTKGTGVVKANGNAVWAYLGYAQITSNFVLSSSQTTPTQVTGLTLTVTIPSGITKVRITAYCATLTVAAGTGVLSIWDGVVNSGTQLSQFNNSNSNGSGVIPQAIVAPAAGSKTYNVGVVNSGPSNTTVNAGATFPAFILVEVC